MTEFEKMLEQLEIECISYGAYPTAEEEQAIKDIKSALVAMHTAQTDNAMDLNYEISNKIYELVRGIFDINNSDDAVSLMSGFADILEPVCNLAATAQTDNALHLRPRAATVRNGKAVGDVPEDGEWVLVHADSGFVVGEFQLEYYGNPVPWVYASPLKIYAWKDVDFWYRLPTINTDADGNMDLPF